MKGQEGVKVPLFSKIFNFGAQYLGNKIFCSKTLKGFLHPHDQENWLHPLLEWIDSCTKTTPPGGPPPPNFFFNPQTSLRGPPWFRKTALQRDSIFRPFLELLNHRRVCLSVRPSVRTSILAQWLQFQSVVPKLVCSMKTKKLASNTTRMVK